MSGLSKKYFHNKGFDKTKLSNGVRGFLAKKVPGYAPTAQELGLRLIERMAIDARVTDIRHMAYMCATACHETKKIRTLQRPVTIKGKPKLDPKTQQPVMRDVRRWEVFNPIEENYRGLKKDYIKAVKVHKQADGSAIVTEQDGDTFKATSTDPKHPYFALNAGIAGKLSSTTVHPTYTNAEGDEQQYFGRGFVQLTWWYNYASISLALGYGLHLLFNPGKVTEYETAYEILVRGMVNGGAYGNRRKLLDYIHDAATDYVGARQMINSRDKASEISQLAEALEELLMNARTAA
jgi:hypothetical protein